MPWVRPPDDYEVRPGDLVRFRIGTLGGWFAPPIWAVEDAVALSDKYEFSAASYDGADLLLELRVAPPPEGPEIIQAGALPGYVIALIAAAGLGLIALLIVKDFEIHVSDTGIDIGTRTSIPGVMVLAAVGAGLLWLSQKK